MNSSLSTTASFLIPQNAVLLYLQPLNNSHFPITTTFLISYSAVTIYLTSHQQPLPYNIHFSDFP